MFSEVFQMVKIVGFCENLPAPVSAVHGSHGACPFRSVLHHEPTALWYRVGGVERLQEGIYG